MASLARWEVKTENRYTAFDGRLYLERRPKLSPNWSARCCHKNKQLYQSTKSPLVSDAQRAAEEWFLDLQSRIRSGAPVTEPTLATAYTSFISFHEHDLLHTGVSNLRKIQNYKQTWSASVQKFFGEVKLSEITTKKLEAFRRWRQDQSKKPLTEKTLHIDLGLVRLVLKHSIRQEWIKYLPQFPTERIQHSSPDWFNQEQLARLITTSQNRMSAEGTGNAAKRIRIERTELHAFVWLMAHGCIRVDEALALKWKDLTPHPANDKVPPFKRQILINIRQGKTGHRQGIGTMGVEIAMNHLRKLHPNAGRDDKLFTTSHQRAMAQLLEAAGPDIQFDEKGRRRNAKTLRHTSIMLRFLNEPDISAFQLGTISGTSVAVLEQYYLRHLTGQRISDQLMQKALAEYSEPKPPTQLVWATKDGEFKGPGAGAFEQRGTGRTPRLDIIEASAVGLQPGRFPNELHHNGQGYEKSREEWAGEGSDRELVSVIYTAKNGDTLDVLNG